MKTTPLSGLVLAVCCTLVTLNSGAQAPAVDKLKVKVRLTPETDVSNKLVPTAVLRANDKAYMVPYLLKGGSGVQSYTKLEPTIELYDRVKLLRIRGQQPTLKVPAGHLFLEDLVWMGGKPVMVAARRDTVQGVVQLYWQYADAGLTAPHKPFELLCAFDAKVWGNGTKYQSGTAFRDEFRTAHSPDSTMLLIHSSDVVDNDGEARRLMAVVDAKMGVLWQQTLEMEDRVQYLSVVLDNGGDAIVLTKHTFTPKEPKKDTTSYSLHLVRVNDGGATEIGTGLGKDQMMKSAMLKTLPDGRVICSAIVLGKDAKGAAVNTHYLGTLPKGGDSFAPLVSLAYKHDTDDAVYTKGAMRPMAVLPRKDGGFYLQREYYLETSANDPKLGMTGLRWVHGPIVTVSVDAKGTELWTGTFRRLYYTTDPNVGQALPLVYDDQLFLFMLDSEVLVDKRKAGDNKLTHQDAKSPYSAYAMFDKEGKTKTKPVLRSSGANDYILGQQVYRFGPEEFYLMGSSKLSGDRLQPVKVEFGE
jgi:hypothetical protein